MYKNILNIGVRHKVYCKNLPCMIILYIKKKNKNRKRVMLPLGDSSYQNVYINNLLLSYILIVPK